MKRNLIALRRRLLALPAQAANIVDEWASVKAPAAPALKPVTVDPKTTALLMLDFMNQNCGKRPRCLADDPGHEEAARRRRAPPRRRSSIRIIANTTTADVIKDVAPQADEPHVSVPDPTSSCDTDLEKILKDKGITTVIAVGTAVERRGALHRAAARPSAA